ncbi:hypothetical protein KQX54_000221, partial [Cotesia glomerata]
TFKHRILHGKGLAVIYGLIMEEIIRCELNTSLRKNTIHHMLVVLDVVVAANTTCRYHQNRCGYNSSTRYRIIAHR